MEQETTSVTFEIEAVHPVKSGKLWLVDVSIDLDGIPLRLLGCRLERVKPKELSFMPPASRLPSGEWRVAVEMPRELQDAIGAEAAAIVFPSAEISTEAAA